MGDSGLFHVVVLVVEMIVRRVCGIGAVMLLCCHAVMLLCCCAGCGCCFDGGL